MQTIVVNATALDRSGALTILKQFIESVPLDANEYLIFISEIVDLKCTQRNIRLIPIAGVKSLHKRFMWDFSGLNKWLEINKVNCIATISLQNTNCRIKGNLPNFVYYHQSIPFIDIKWNIFKSEERALWFYKNIYPFFVKFFINDKTEFFVQLDFIKESFSKKFDVAKSKIHVVAPKIVLPTFNGEITMDVEKDTINLFYPASSFFYKNHQCLFDALSILNNKRFILYLTCEKEEFVILPENVEIRFLGIITFEQVLQMYTLCDALLFPSYIETYGLPLIEAASFGKTIIAADLPYAKEVLAGYEGVQFVDYTDAHLWATAIGSLGNKNIYKSFSRLNLKSWESLFEIIKLNL